MFEIKRITCEKKSQNCPETYNDIVVEIKINNETIVSFSRRETVDLIAGTNIHENENYCVIFDKSTENKLVRRGTDGLSLDQANDIFAMICELEK